MNAITAGVLAVLLYTGLIAAADGIVKMMAGGFAPAQLFAVSGLLVAGFSVIVSRVQGHPDGLRTTCRRAMMLRSAATVLSCTSFYLAFRYLALAEVFVFIALMPLMAALMSCRVAGAQPWGRGYSGDAPDGAGGRCHWFGSGGEWRGLWDAVDHHGALYQPL